MNGLFVEWTAAGPTPVLVVDEHGAELATAERSGQRDPAWRDLAVRRVIRDAVQRACAGLGSGTSALRIGVAGAGRDEERDTLQAALDADRVAGTVVLTDAETRWKMRSARVRVLLTAGTGSIAYGKDPLA
jgi:N-acetylglucosamine kinase-like BadF-type ATPase